MAPMSMRRAGFDSGRRGGDPALGLVGRFYNAITLLRCPHCGAESRHVIGRFERPGEFGCEGCGAAIAAPAERCCIYCAYGTVPCAQGQSDRRLLRLIGVARVVR